MFAAIMEFEGSTRRRRRATKIEPELVPMEPENKRAKVEPLVLSKMAPFYVGVYADGRSWGTRIHELIRYGYGYADEETLDQWSPQDFRVTKEIGHGKFDRGDRELGKIGKTNT